MGAAILDGAAIAAAVRAELAEEVASLEQVGITPGLGTILVGDNPASASYVRLKHQDCEEIGIRSFGEHLPEDATQDRLLQLIAEYNANPDIDAFLVQLPLPKQLDELAAAGIGAVVQPGGSLRDEEVITAADEQGIAMVFTGERHFRH